MDDFEKRRKRNNANRGRGKSLERKIAKTLGWIRVPYSGSSDVYGRGDVVDILDIHISKWVVEAKTSTHQNYRIKAEWMEKMYDDQQRLGGLGHWPKRVAIALRLYQSSEIWLAMPQKQLSMKWVRRCQWSDAPKPLNCRIYAPASIVVQREDLLRVDSAIFVLEIMNDTVNGQLGCLPKPCPDWLKFWWPTVLMPLHIFAEYVKFKER